MVRIPINVQPIPAYTRVERSQLLNPTTGGLMFQRLPPNSVVGMSIVGIDTNGSHVSGKIVGVKRVQDEVVFLLEDKSEVLQSQTSTLGGAIMNPSAIVGRVVKRDKRPGLGFQESTFFAQGTPEGIAGATPNGMRALTLDATKLTGVHALEAGDQIDLMASMESPDSALDPVDSENGDDEKGNELREPFLLAQKAIVLKPVYVRNEASTSASLTQGTRIQNVPKYEVAIAVQPDDLIPLQRAINQSLTITCIAHSMKPESNNATEGANEKTTSSESHEVQVPVLVNPVLAYHVITRESFVSPATRNLRFETKHRDDVQRMDIITSLDEAIGSIARHDMPAGSYLRRSDILSGPPTRKSPPATAPDDRKTTGSHPVSSSGQHWVHYVQEADETANSATAVGERPSITRYIPAGRTAFAIPWNRIYGSEHLQIGDEIDLMVSFTLESMEEREETETRSDGTVVVRKSDSIGTRETQRTWDESFGFRAEPWFVATDALVIAPVGFPAPASAMRSLGNELTRRASGSGAPSRMDGPPVILAVEDRDVEAFAAALASRDALFTVAFHSDAISQEKLEPGTKRIVVTSVPLQPFQEFHENAWSGNRRRIATQLVSEEDRRYANAITVEEVHLFYGRVLREAKAKGEFLSSDDFMPVGTKGGLAAGVRSGETFLPVSDRQIEGLDSFEAEDHVAILLRGVFKPQFSSGSSVELTRAVSKVVVADARIARSSRAGQTILSVRNEDLSALQVALAQSIQDSEGGAGGQLIAVVKARADAVPDTPVASDTIPSLDPLSNVRFMEKIVGSKRTLQAFPGGK